MPQQHQPQTPESADVPKQQKRGKAGTVSNLDREGVPAGARPIAGVKAGWYFRETDRMILHRSKEAAPALPIGAVPLILGRITYRMSDRRHTKIAYQIQTEEGPRIVSAEEVLDGTWADKAGRDRPVNSDERQAYARIMSEEVRAASELPALPVKDKDGGLVLPDADAQELGYLRTGDPDEAAAREGWQRVLALAMQSERTTLAMSAMFCGPLVSSLKGVVAHILNLQGTGQQGKSTQQRIMCALMGDPSDSYELMGTMNSTGLALPEVLIEARYLPMCREETSASALSLPELEKLFSRIVAGGKRSRLGQGGKLKQGAGTWHSIFVTSSNESLLRPGQVESLASRLIQMSAPFYAGADAGMEAWDLAAQYHGWPLVWARRTGMFEAPAVQEWRRLHTEIVDRLTTPEAREIGGIPLTLARIVAAWCVGGYMLGEVLGMPEIGSKVEEDARRELPRILGDVTETHLSAGQIMWEAISGAIAQEPAAWVAASSLAPEIWSATEFKPRKVLGYYHQGRVHVYVATLKDAVKEAGLDTPVPGLKDLQQRGVLVTEERTKYASKHPTRELRKQIPGRVYVFDTEAAQEAFKDRETTPDVTPDTVPDPADDSATVASEQRAIDAAMSSPATGQTPCGGVTTPRHRDSTTSEVKAPPKPGVPPAVVYPAGTGEVTDTAFASLVERAAGRTLSATRFGVLGAGVLHLPNRTAVSVPMPGTVDDVPALMAAYKLKTLWLHQDAIEAMGLPSFEERRELGMAQTRAAEGKTEGEPVKPPGAMNPVAHQWAVPGAGSPVAEVFPAGLTAWMTLKLVDQTARDKRITVAVPSYEHRFDKPKQSGRGGFGGAPTPEILLDALMVWTLSTVHGTQEWPKVVPYYQGPNQTGEDFAGGPGRDDVLCDAVRQGAVPPAVGVRICPLMVPQQWHREPTEAERGAGFVHRYDKTAAWLAAFGPTKLGIGEPTHGGAGTLYNRAWAGFWRVADVPGTGLPGLPELRFREMEEGGYWLATPSVDLLRELYPDWTPVVLESWHWETSKAALSGMYKLMSTSRTRIVAAAEAGRPGAKWAKQVNGRVYQSFRGYLARSTGPQRDHATGGDYRQDIYYRPDWAALLMSHATANMYRNLVKFSTVDGMAPLSVYVDAATFPSDEADPIAGKPGSMLIGTRGGSWTSEGTAPMGELLPLLDSESTKHGAHSALDAILTRGE
ncbi:DUF927 domain-containing protein [Streptomyces niveus]|uniref:DUF927 domain-containing protein n=1 Tax=Streptomyces niveus TaxID=193462 RepID=UPI0003C5E2F0|nr:DUF927 domain-containing protein [Streptomyces niveus]EST17863.1 hypothetical protein M877_40100 [Streptomyces niveus NCIMB 11891]